MIEGNKSLNLLLSIIKSLERFYFLELVFIAISMLALFKTLPITELTIVFLVYAIIRCNLYENVFSFIVFFPYIAGNIFNAIGVSSIGGAMKYSGLVVLFVLVALRIAKLKNITQGIWPLLVLLLLFFLSVNTTIGGDYANRKLSSTIRHGIILFFGFSFMFSNLKKFDFVKLGVLFIVLSSFMLPLAIVANGISGPTNLFDFSFLRYQTEEDFFNEYGFHIGYQAVGFLMVQGVGFFLTGIKKYKIPNISVGLILVSVLAVLVYAGSRQAIVAYFIIVFVWILFAQQGKSLFVNGVISKKRVLELFKWLFLLLGIIVVTYYVVNLLTGDEGLLNSLAEEGFVEGGGRGEWLMSGVNQFLEHPVWGVGYGRFMVYNYYGSYPHNLFVELLCETGLVGFTVAAVLVLIATLRSRKYLLSFLYLWLAYFSRSMASEDISMNITVFVILFAMISADYDAKPTETDMNVCSQEIIRDQSNV